MIVNIPLSDSNEDVWFSEDDYETRESVKPSNLPENIPPITLPFSLPEILPIKPITDNTN